MNAVVQRTDPTPSTLLAMAVEKGADLDKLEKLMELKERWEASEARKAFVVAMNAFKAEPLVIVKRQLVDFPGKGGGRTSYRHANLADVTEVVAPAMAQHGLSYRWTVAQEASQVTVACVVTHALGHSEQVQMTGPLDDSGNKNKIQQAGSTVTYLQRYTLLAVTGLSTQDQDDDGQGADDDGEPLSAVDEEALTALQGASMHGEDALRAAFQSSPISDAGWQRHRESLVAAAKQADREAKARR